MNFRIKHSNAELVVDPDLIIILMDDCGRVRGKLVSRDDAYELPDTWEIRVVAPSDWARELPWYSQEPQA